MAKRIISLLLIFVLALSLASCSFVSELINARRTYRHYMTEYGKQKGKVDIVWTDENEDEYLNYYAEYNEKRYNLDHYGLFEPMYDTSLPMDQCAAEGDVLIGWECASFGFSFLDLYYSNTSDDPVFIYAPRLRDLYIREDYTCETDTFVIEGTDQSFVFSDMLTLVDSAKRDYLRPHLVSPDFISCTLYSESCSRLRIALELVSVDNEWFARVHHNSVYWFAVSDELLYELNIDTVIQGS